MEPHKKLFSFPAVVVVDVVVVVDGVATFSPFVLLIRKIIPRRVIN